MKPPRQRRDPSADGCALLLAAWFLGTLVLGATVLFLVLVFRLGMGLL